MLAKGLNGATYVLSWYEALSSPSEPDGLDMEVMRASYKQGGQRVSQTALCVGGTERETL